MNRPQKSIIMILFPLFAVSYFLTGFFSLQSGQHAIIQRLGKVTGATTTPGIHYCLPWPIEKANKVKVSEVKTIAIGAVDKKTREFFTGDENLVNVRALISYDIKDPKQYLFGAADVDALVGSTGQMLLGRELGMMTVDESMTSGKSSIRIAVKERMQKKLDEMQVGVRIISLELADITAPEKVEAAFKKVSTARVKKQEIIREAEGYANSVAPKTRGRMAAIISEAEALSNEIVNRAKAGANAFDKMLAEYRQYPDIVKSQKYLDTIRSISGRAQIRIDTNPGHSTYVVRGDAPANHPPDLGMRIKKDE